MPNPRERAALEVLRRVEWAGLKDHPEGGYYGACPRCGGGDPDNPAVPKGHVGHAPDCALDAVLRATPVADSYWWCPECREVVDASRVTYQELHDTCGTRVETRATPASDGGEVRERVGREISEIIGEEGGVATEWDDLDEGSREACRAYADRILALLSGSGTPPGEGKVRVAAAAYLDALDEYRQECRTRDIPLAEYDYHEWRRLAEPVTVAERRLHEALRSAPSGVEEGEAIATVARMIADAPVLGNKRDLARQILAYLRAAPVPAREGEEHGYWWCPECREEVDGSRVTYSHDSCGREVVWKDPLPPVNEDARTRLREELEAWIAEDRPGVVRPPFPLYLDDARTVAALLRTPSDEGEASRRLLWEAARVLGEIGGALEGPHDSVDWGVLRTDLRRFRRRLAAAALRSESPEAPSGEGEVIYPCRQCGTPRTAAEGGTTFTVCDECWDRQYGRLAARRGEGGGE